MTRDFSQATQDYLKQIFKLTEQGESASTNVLSARLRIAGFLSKHSG